MVPAPVRLSQRISCAPMRLKAHTGASRVTVLIVVCSSSSGPPGSGRAMAGEEAARATASEAKTSPTNRVAFRVEVMGFPLSRAMIPISPPCSLDPFRGIGNAPSRNRTKP